MKDQEIRAAVMTLLQRVAPEVLPEAVDDKLALREQVDLDSMDFLNFLIAVHDRFQVDIPETAYESLRTVDDIVAYVRARSAPK